MPLLTYKNLRTYENSKKIVADAMYHPASKDEKFDIFYHIVTSTNHWPAV